MNRATTMAAILMTAQLGGCAVLPPPETGTSSDGGHWVKLSSDDDVLGDLETTASSAGCAVEGRGSEGQVGYRELRVSCRGDRVLISQESNLLRFRCGTLRGDDCDALMQTIAPRPTRRCF